MPLKTFVSAGVFDDHIGTTTLGGTNSNLTTGGITSAGFTAPNLVNAATGIWVFYNGVPTLGNAVISLLESGVPKVSATMNPADIRLGWNYARFTTPYTFATLTALAYTVRAANDTGTSGSLVSGSGTTITTSVTYNTATTLNANDNLWVAGFHNSGMTAKTLTLSGTVANVIGDGLETLQSNGFLASVGAAVTVGTGGTVLYDTAVSTTVTIRGSINTYGTGIYNGSGNVADMTRVSTTIIDSNTTNGQFGFMQATNSRGGQFLFVGLRRNNFSTYASGLGTAASPMIISVTKDWQVGDEIVVGTSTAHNQNEKRFIITRNSGTSYVLSATSGGAESGLSFTHAVGVHIANMTSNCVVKPLTTTRGYKAYMAVANSGSSFNGCRFEHPSGASSHGLNLDYLTSATGFASTYDNAVIFENSTGNRNVINIQGTTSTQTISGLIFYNCLATNLSNAALGVSTTSNKNFVDCFYFNGQAGTTGGQFIGLAVTSYKNTFTNCHSYGTNSNATANIGAVSVASSGSNTFNSCSFNAGRLQAIVLNGSTESEFNNCGFGNFFTNAIDILTISSTQNTALFNSCNFGSATLISNYINQLEGSLARFHRYNTTNNRHRWYTTNGSGYSSGAGLDETTVATAGSLATALLPETATGLRFQYRIPVRVGEVISVFGDFWCNATALADVGSTLTAELFLPGSLVADQTVTMTKTTDPTSNNAVYRLGLVNTSGTSDVATVRLTARGTVAGGKAFVDDLNGGTNLISGLDIWYEGQPLAFQLTPETLGDPAAAAEATRTAIWSDTTTYTGTQKGKVVVDTNKLAKSIRYNNV